MFECGVPLLVLRTDQDLYLVITAITAQISGGGNLLPISGSGKNGIHCLHVPTFMGAYLVLLGFRVGRAALEYPATRNTKFIR